MTQPSPRDLVTSLPGNRFEVRRLLGWGGMGVVYEAFDKKRRAKVAIKTLRSMDAAALLRFKNEFRALADLAHPNLIRLGELIEEAGQLFFTMELVNGMPFVDHVRGVEASSIAPPLHDALTPGELPAPDALDTAVRADATKPSDRAPPLAPGTFDEAKLRAALPQLARGLRALHASGRVHRDIKPSNILVTPEGRVVILDFGLVTDAAGDTAGEEPHVVGTAHFMAPEQAAGRVVGPAADWYAVGVMLYEAITGVLPFDVASDAVRSLKQRSTPLPPSAISPDTPLDLDNLVMRLLRIDPTERPTGDEILALLGEVRAPISTSGGTGHAVFVGRERELFELSQSFEDAVRGAVRVVLVEGESGVGKSTLVRRFLDSVAPSALVLAARCYERESVPYKAVDGLMDRLGTLLSKLPPHEVSALLPEDMGLAASVFPVLALAEPVAAKTARPVAGPLGDTGLVLDLLDANDPADAGPPSLSKAPRGSHMEPSERRARVFGAMRRLFAELSADKPVILAIDDLQWADADSLALLSEILRPETPAELAGRRGPAPLLLVASVRTGTDITSPSSAVLDVPAELLRVVQVTRLAPQEARKLVLHLLDALAAGVPIDPSLDVADLLAEGSGHPLFLDALVRHRLTSAGSSAKVRLDDALWARINALSPRARMLLAMISVTGAPVARGVTQHALSADVEEVERLIGELRVEHFVRAGGAGEDEALEPYHDRIRETVLSHMRRDELRGWHARIALALETTGSGALEDLSVHWLGAGDEARAAQYAARAGDEAATAFAFERAARLYAAALSLVPKGAPQRASLFVRRGDALSHGGRGRDAAEAYCAAAELYPEASALELRRRAAENLLRSGYLEEGLTELRSVLAGVGVDYPATPAAAVAALLLRRAELRLFGLRFHERPASRIPPAELRRIDACWSASMGLSMVDTLRGAYFQIRSLLFALKAGDPYRISRALSMEIPFVATAGPSARRRVDELTLAARESAERSRHPHALALVPGVSGVALFLEGRFLEAPPLLAESEDQLRSRCVGVTWETASILTFSLWCLWFLGDFAGLAARAPAVIREAEERGDRYLATNLCSSFTNVIWLLADDPDLAEKRAASAIGAWARGASHLQHFHDLVARVFIALYRGDGPRALRTIEEGWSALDESMILRIQLVRIVCELLRGMAAVAAADGPERAARIALATRSAKRIEGEHVAWGAPLGALLRACARVREGQRGAAVTGLLEEAVRGSESCAMAGFALAARRMLGAVRGGEEGSRLIEAADKELRARGAKRPDKIAAMLAPGLGP